MNTKQRALAITGAGIIGLLALMNVAGAQEAPTTTAPTLETPAPAPDAANRDGHDCPDGGRGHGGGGGGGGGAADRGTAPSTGGADNVGYRI